METRIIETRLKERQEVFRLLAVAEAMQKPILMVGPAGVGKTRALLDYAHAYYQAQGKGKSARQDAFVLETDEGTRSTEVRGRIDIEKLTTEKKWVLDTPIAESEFLLINEIDKANAGLRNSLLGVMNERILFAGKDKINCNWKVFCASCNVIPEDEVGNPFWDRFVLKINVPRMSKSSLLSYYSTGGAESTLKINIPNSTELNEVAARLNPDKLGKLVETCYDSLSDRTLSFMPQLVAAVATVYNVGEVKAMVKAVDIVAGSAKSKQFAKLVEPQELATARAMVEAIGNMSDYDTICNQIENVKNYIQGTLRGNGLISESDIQEIKEELQVTVDDNPAFNMDTEYVETEVDTSMVQSI